MLYTVLVARMIHVIK